MRYFLLNILFGALSISNCLNAYSHDKNQFTLSRLVNEVVQRNPSLASINARVYAAHFVIDRVSTPSDPQFMWMTDDNSFGSKKNDLMPVYRYQLAQTIPFPGKLSLKAEIAQRRLDVIRNKEITTKQELILQTKKLFFQLYFNYAARTTNQYNQKIVSQIRAAALALYKTIKYYQKHIFK